MRHTHTLTPRAVITRGPSSSSSSSRARLAAGALAGLGLPAPEAPEAAALAAAPFSALFCATSALFCSTSFWILAKAAGVIWMVLLLILLKRSRDECALWGPGKRIESPGSRPCIYSRGFPGRSGRVARAGQSPREQPGARASSPEPKAQRPAVLSGRSMPFSIFSFAALLSP